jgi:hypothetical protein
MKSSYNKRKEEIEKLKLEVEELKKALCQESKSFFNEIRWLGIGDMTTGVVVNGKLKEIYRQKIHPSNNARLVVEFKK